MSFARWLIVNCVEATVSQPLGTETGTESGTETETETETETATETEPVTETVTGTGAGTETETEPETETEIEIKTGTATETETETARVFAAVRASAVDVDDVRASRSGRNGPSRVAPRCRLMVGAVAFKVAAHKPRKAFAVGP